MWKCRAAVCLFLGAAVLKTPTAVAQTTNLPDVGGDVARNAQRMLDEGKQTFRFDTFGEEAFWSGALQLQRAIAGSANGGVGGGVSPKTALSVGLKVDVEALPKDLVAAIKAGKVNLDDPATTLEAGEFIKQHVPGARIAVLEAAHIANIEQPKVYADTVLEFLLN